MGSHSTKEEKSYLNSILGLSASARKTGSVARDSQTFKTKEI